MRNKKAYIISRDMVQMYLRYRVSRSAAAFSYFLTLTVFPLLICLYTMLRQYIPDTGEILALLEGVIPEDTLSTLTDYVAYVRTNSSTAMFIAGIVVMVTSSSAAFRTLHSTFADMQGKARFHGVFYMLFSVIFSVVVLIIMYFGIIVILSGDWLLRFFAQFWPGFDVSLAWKWIRFVGLFALLLLLTYGIYRFTAPRGAEKNLFLGALAASLSLVVVSMIFSLFIGMSVRYPLVYGSLASIIILMFWLYICGTIIIMGDALNMVIRDLRAVDPDPDELEEPEPDC